MLFWEGIMGRSTSNHELLMKLVESGEIQLSAIARMDYDDLEELCTQILNWKLFVGNREHIPEAISQWAGHKET
jgi:hypothetical protein